MAETIVPVLLPVPLDQVFDYLADGPLPPGTVVEVPFGPRRLIGVVWEAPPRPEEGRRPARLRAVQRRLDAPPLPDQIRRLVDRVRLETLAPWGAVLKLVLSVPAALEPPEPRLGYRLGPAEARLTAARKKVLEVLGDSPLLPAELARRAGVGSAVVRGMAELGLLDAVPLPEPEPPAPDPARSGPALSPAQAEAAAALEAAVDRAEPAVVLLEGVPGAGKTEVYLEAVARALARGRRVLVLLPEIALSPAWLARFEARFGAPPALWHSELTGAVRRRTWRRIAEGRAPVVVGARSALFLPQSGLGLIVVDEEHDSSFKQDDGVTYHARDAALIRGEIESCPVVLASATPSIETLVRTGALGDPPQPRTGRLLLPARHGEAPLPRIELVDLRARRGAWLSPPLVQGLEAALAAGEQALLFLNRRGYAPLTLCRACGHRLGCPNCSAWLVSHRLRRRLLCHHCGYSEPQPEHCPHCGAVDSLHAAGPGVERLAEEVAGLLPEARVRLLTSDQPARPSEVAALLDDMASGAIDVLIGTQIVAKGHHFPGLTLVGVVDGDMGLAGGDLRAAERTFQLLYQVAGRAGRGARPGRVLIQTHMPDHPVMLALARGDKDAACRLERDERRLSGMPPFGRLAALIVSGPDASRVAEAARAIARAAPVVEGLTVLGPAPAPLALLRGRHRERLLVKARPEVDLPARLRAWLRPIRLPARVRLLVDVDPYSFL
jgi:primosomal protein N' (replication factor Y) (superfamily II helicase)